MTTPNHETTPHDEPAIRVEGLDFYFVPRRPVLSDLSFEVPRGSICGLVGPNGCGKTTLIQLLLGVFRPWSGRIRMLGKDPGVDPIGIRRRVGYVPQVSDLVPTMTVAQTFDFLQPYFEPYWQPEKVAQLCERFGLDANRAVPLGDLSVGLRQRVSLVAALAIEPELLLLDEPTAGLDAVVRREFAEAVVEYTSEAGRTVLLSSHLIGELERLIDHLVILRGQNTPIVCSLDVLKTRSVCLVGRFGEVPQGYPEMPGLLGVRRVRDQLRLVFWDEGKALDEARRWLAEMGALEIELDEDSSLESRFVDLVAVS